MAKQTKASSKKKTTRLPMVAGGDRYCTGADMAALTARVAALESIVSVITTAPSGSLFYAEDGVLVALPPPTGVRRLTWDGTALVWFPE
jgi:hypothetical protein